MDLDVIYNMDCLEGLKQLPDSCIDLTVTSPPYDNLRTYNGFTFDFENIAKELYRVTKPGGVVVWVVGDATVKGSETGTSFKQALYFKEIGFNLHDTMIYGKNNPMPNINHKRYAQAFEYMFILSKGAVKTFNPIMEPCTYAGTYTFGNPSTWNESGELIKKNKRKINDFKKKSNIFYYTVGSTASKNIKHPAVFPEKLAEDNILSWSNPNDIILDPFVGSGTTALMCIKNNRRYIGYEISKEYCDIINERISDYKQEVISCF
jgi:site-specific DNA-methyltransferase (adenine-specific)